MTSFGNRAGWRSRLTANIAFMFADLPFLQRIDAAKAAGFDKVECHFPYDTELSTLHKRLTEANVKMTGLNTAPGNAAAGEWGLAGAPGREEEFEQHFAQALIYAETLGAGVIHAMAAVVAENNRAAALRTYIDNIRRVAPRAARAGITLLLEPLNTRDKPDYLISCSDEVVEIIAEIDQPNVKLLFDVYHVQIMEGDLTRRLERHLSHIGHVQIAAVPDRGEPDVSEVALGHILDTLSGIGYDGLIGLEYKPRGDTATGLSWMDRIL